MTVSFPPKLRPYFIPKGSVALDGVSLTVALLGPSSLEVELIPLTLQGSNLGRLGAGAKVNIECDMIGKFPANYWNREVIEYALRKIDKLKL